MFISSYAIQLQFHCSNSTGKRPVFLGGLSVAADLVSYENGCYTINVRVYLTYDGEVLLLANSNVQVGNCQNKVGNNESVDCKDQLFKGDYFYYSKDKFKYCVVYLLEDEVTYAKYVIERNRVIDSVKR